MQGGVLTFLFTDIEASTRRWEADPAAMSAALVRHDQIVRAAIEAHGGEVFKHTGDGMCAVFASAPAAVVGAVAAQEALSGETLRGRVGVHTGTAESRDGDWFGPTLNRAARLMAAAHGGQIVISAATAELARDDLPAGAALRDLGEHRLADLVRPERVYQLDREAGQVDFPPLRSLSAHRHNLPGSLTSFVGREHELGEIAELLKRSRLVTLTGVGGGGKTRLATEAGARALEGFPDGVFLVELAPLVDPDMVPATVAGALGLILDRPGPLVDHLAEYLANRVTLVVLDNCEHLIDAAASLTEALLQRTGGVVVLATSREPLGVGGETVWRIPPLNGTDAVTLLCDRARAANPTFTPTAADGDALGRIGARLDGLPLALELAAARLHVLSAREIADRLDDRFRLLTGGARTAVDRHRTLRAAIDWGYDLLSEPDRALLRSLSVFAGGFDLAAAEAVGGDDTLDGLGRLVDRSWVAVEPPTDGPTRYRLTETVRHYAAEKLLDGGEADEARQRHCDHFRRLARGDGKVLRVVPAWLRTARTEADNLRAAFEWSESRGDGGSCVDIAAGLGGYFFFGSQPLEGPALLERALAAAPDDAPGVWRALLHLAIFLTGSAEFDSAEVAARRALEMAQAAGDVSYEYQTQLPLGIIALARGEIDQAAGILGRAFARLVTTDVALAGWAAHNLAWAELARGDSGAATRWFEVALRSAGDPDEAILAMHASAGLARLAASAGETDRALALADEAVAPARGLELPFLLIMTLTRAAETAVLVGATQRAVAALAESVSLLRQVGTRGWAADSLELVAVIAAHRGAHGNAARLLGAARGIEVATRGAGRSPAPGAGLARARAHNALGDERFESELAAGAALTLDAALALAQAELAR